ncbi:DUF1707 domain-containing protein [Streptomyces sp. NPDC057638]|uniref:DUF1707 SHOCT-like domain-containing protein n=1 Tax=Streptomyces sp. NPDC057638 TaxID=3346190 RepID=UPI0036A13B17
MTSPPEHPPQLVSDDDRESAVRRLQDAYAEGRLAHEDMDGRLQGALTATTREELERALTGLPADPADTVSTIAAGGGRIVRRGVWRVPRSLIVESALGRVRLDLSRAVFEHPVVDIELRLGMGGAKITVPRDAIVETEALTAGWKGPVYQAPRRSGGAGPRIRISGTMGYGKLTVRHARR